MDLSVVIPLYNEEESLRPLTEWIERVAAPLYDFEIIFVDDGSTDSSWQVIRQLAETRPYVRAVSFRRNYGKSAALYAGFELCKGAVVITMDADLQDSPDEIPELYRMIREDGYHLVSGWKKKRRDPLSKRLPSRIFNRVVRLVSGIKLHDFNCGLKAYQKQVVKNIEVYGEMHRYIPLLAKWSGFRNVGEKVVEHYPRRYGKTKFGLERIINGFLDVLSIMFVGKFGKRPMHFFGTIGVLSIFIGFALLLYLAVLKIFKNIGFMTDRPLFYFGIILLIIGTQLFLTGFLAELIVRNAPGRNRYHIRSRIGD
ncbi:MAG: glycosyltransferase family 2 protein [Saprospiraceae bacterium]|nr:glycosyltransferase family 2 protein [Saprospiraceae bacterium]